MITVVIPGVMQAKERPRFGNGRAYTADRTRAAENAIAVHALAQVGQPRLTGALGLRMVFTRAIPPSWSAKRKALALSGGVRPTSRPDLDNCEKMIDALKGILWVDDAQIVEKITAKFYGLNPRTEMTVWQLEGVQ